MPHSGVGFHWVTVAHPDYGQIACILDEGELLLPINTIYRLFSINNTQSDEILSFITKNLEYHALFYTADRYSCVFCIYLADLDLVLDGVA